MFFNKFVNNLRAYKVSTHKAWQIKDKSNVLKLDWNEATIPPSPKVKEAIINFANNGFMNWYPDVDNKKLRDSLSKYSDVDSENLEYFASSDALHEYIIRAFINPGDKITMIGPTYDNFRAAAESIGAEIDYFWLEEDEDFKFSYSRFESHVQFTCPKIVYLCNPNNPTGTNYSLNILESLVKRFNDVLFIIDEAYYEFSGVSAAKIASQYENIVVSRTFSKAFGLASFRIGYAIASNININGLRKLRNPKNISSYAQLAAEAALSDLEYMNNYVKDISKQKEIFAKNLNSIGINKIWKGGGNYILIKFGEIQDEIIDALEKNLIFVRNYGHVNGGENYTRITIGTSDQMTKVFNIIKATYK